MYIITYANTFLKLYTPLPNSFVTQKHHSSTELHIKTVWLIFTRILRSLYSDINRCVCVCVCVFLRSYACALYPAAHILFRKHIHKLLNGSGERIKNECASLFRLLHVLVLLLFSYNDFIFQNN